MQALNLALLPVLPPPGTVLPLEQAAASSAVAVARARAAPPRRPGRHGRPKCWVMVNLRLLGGPNGRGGNEDLRRRRFGVGIERDAVRRDRAGDKPHDLPCTRVA